MMAEETRGPMNADVLPTTEKSAKKRNLCMYVVGAWVTGSVSFLGHHRTKGNWDRGRTEIAVCVHLGRWGDFADHRLAVCVPWAHHQAIVCLVQPDAGAHELRGLSGEREVVPDLPDVFEAEFVSVDPNEAPDGEDEDPEHVETEHLCCRYHVTRVVRSENMWIRTVFVGIWKRFCTSQNKLDST